MIISVQSKAPTLHSHIFSIILIMNQCEIVKSVLSKKIMNIYRFADLFHNYF